MTDRPLEPPLDDRSPDASDSGHIVPPENVPPISAEELVDGDHHPSDQHEERRYPSTIGGAFYLLVLAVTVTGLALASLSDWRIGIRVVGGSLLFAAVVRTVLGPRDAGMLAVRHKALDAALLAGLGVALIFLTTSIPDQPGL